ncbi:hypothetical protein AK812_SmicGene40958 [Symbiodinium microadriaticum]|uniref:Uncharacterized protein n=1 Tax=Symbiodinium microadriaticum TaxID=2951 RepID=A0A1Q9C7B6_SYMMI|nr:hypothetical protein AK812_SmicGene40958 [Symbiodinium microadriaticum]CAE7295897.1 unnamed protein product [Symbiodinium microadriaticum]
MARSYCWIFFAQLVACHMQADATSATRGNLRHWFIGHAIAVSPEPIICRADLPTVDRQYEHYVGPWPVRIVGFSSHSVEQSPAEELLLCCNEIAHTFAVLRAGSAEFRLSLRC